MPARLAASSDSTETSAPVSNSTRIRAPFTYATLAVCASFEAVNSSSTDTGCAVPLAQYAKLTFLQSCGRNSRITPLARSYSSSCDAKTFWPRRPTAPWPRSLPPTRNTTSGIATLNRLKVLTFVSHAPPRHQHPEVDAKRCVLQVQIQLRRRCRRQHAVDGAGVGDQLHVPAVDAGTDHGLQTFHRDRQLRQPPQGAASGLEGRADDKGEEGHQGTAPRRAAAAARSSDGDCPQRTCPPVHKFTLPPQA